MSKWAFFKLIGSWLEGSGWTTALEVANVASSGTAESFIKMSPDPEGLTR